MHCRHCGCWVVAVLMPVAGVIGEGKFHCVARVVDPTFSSFSSSTFHLIWKLYIQTVSCKGGTVLDCPFLTQNDVLKGWKCGADSRTLITLSPLEQRFEPWPPEFPVDAIISGHHILKASLFHITDLKKYLDLVKLKCCFFILRKGVSASNFPCFFQMYNFSC